MQGHQQVQCRSKIIVWLFVDIIDINCVVSKIVYWLLFDNKKMLMPNISLMGNIFEMTDVS